MDYSEVKDIDQAATVTVGELRAAVARVLPEQFDEMSKAEAETFADDIVYDLFGHREPEWLLFDVVLDSNNSVWRRARASSWHMMGSGRLYGHHAPVRPLKLLHRDSDAER